MRAHVVFTSYGVLCWLHDIEAWAGIVSRYLKPGGTFFMAELHPFIWVFDYEFPSELRARLARSFYEGLASMVRAGLVDIETAYELNPPGVTRYWEKMGPIAKEFRERNDYPGYMEPVEYLAGEVAKLRDRKGDPTPKPLKTPREPVT
jgi:hypothetical protein